MLPIVSGRSWIWVEGSDSWTTVSANLPSVHAVRFGALARA
jgi:hypothetical protein